MNKLTPRVITTFLILLCLFACSSNFAKPPPNILLLVAEDLSPRIASFGDPTALTPNIDALAQAGVRYTNVFTSAGVCAPSRAALITGQHQISFGAQHMRSYNSKLGTYYPQPAEDVKAFPELLRRAGYYTFTDTKLDYQFSEIGSGTGPFTIWDAEGENTHWRNRAKGQPFFGLINFMHTHESGVMHPTGKAHSPAHKYTQQMRKKFDLVAPAVTDPAAVVLPSYYPDTDSVRTDIARHYDNIQYMDLQVGQVLDELKQDGLIDNTIVIWTSDHGDGLPRAKRELYDSGIKVPMVVFIPESIDIPELKKLSAPGAENNKLISFVDLAPTLLFLAGITAQDYHHGINFLTEDRDYIFASRDRIDEVMDRQRAVRDTRHKYIRSWYPQIPGGHKLSYRDNIDMVRTMRAMYERGKLSPAQARWFEAPGVEQLYDIRQDPEELVNIAERADSADIKSNLSEQLDAWLHRVGDMGEIPESKMRDAFLNEGNVPITPVPTAKTLDNKIHLFAQSKASIGYRANKGDWELYSVPLDASMIKKLEFKAVRYGWQESAVISLSFD